MPIHVIEEPNKQKRTSQDFNYRECNYSFFFSAAKWSETFYCKLELNLNILFWHGMLLDLECIPFQQSLML